MSETTTKLAVTFYGGVGSVTGANFLLENSDTKVLVDCGLQQGRFEKDTDPNQKVFAYSASEIDFLVVTHAHIDHIGRIGKLIKEGFTGTIISTPPTRDIAEFMLEDAVKIMSYEEKRFNKPKLYESHHAVQAFENWKTIEYHEEMKLGSFSLFCKDAGHILGSVIAELTDTHSKKKIVFTGDLGNTPTPLLKDTEKVFDADYMITESVYGDRNHEHRSERKSKIKEVINKVVKRGGTLMVPVFSLEKTQVFLKELNDLIEDGEVQSVPVYFDSPLGIKVTDVYARSTKYFNEDVQQEIKAGDDIFDFPKLKVTMRQQESRSIDKHHGPKIIIASSGMSEGGRITAHEKKFLPDKNNALLLIGYQVAGSMGRRLQEGKKKVRMGKDWVKVRANIYTVSGYSSHKDSDGLVDFISHSRDSLKKVFVCMGETKSSLFLTQRIREFLGVDAMVPDEGERVELE